MRTVRPLIKWLLLALGVVLLLAIGLVVAVVTLVDPDRFRPAIVSAVQQATGRSLSLDGSVGLSFFPCCAVEVSDVTLGNPPGFPGDPFLRADSARLALRLWPLVTRRAVELGTVRVTGLRANLVGQADGTNNWTFTGAGADEPAAAGGGDAGIASLDVAGITIEDAEISYADAADGSRYRVSDLGLSTGAIRSGEPFDLTTSFRLTDLADESGGSLKLSSTVTLTLGEDLTAIGLGAVAAEFDLAGFAGLDRLQGTARGPVLTAELATNTRVAAPELAVQLTAAGEGLPGEGLALEAAVTGLRYDMDAGTGTIGGFTGSTTAAGAAVELAGAGTFGDRTALRGTVRIAEFSPRDALAKLGAEVPVTADPKALTRLSGTADWSLDESSVALAKMALVLDDTRVSGSASREQLPDGSTATPRTRFDLVLDRLDADRYLEPAAAGGGAGDESTDEAPTPIPVETIRGLNLTGRARVGQLVYDGLPLADVDVTVAADGGRLRLEPLGARLYGGQLKGGLRVDATGPKARVTVDQAMTGLDLGALLAGISDVRNLRGTMTARLNGSAVGATDDELLTTLAGNLDFALADGVYQGMDVWYEIRRARALIRRKAPPARTGAEETPIRALRLTGKLADGVLRTDQLTAEIPFLRVSGAATVDLPKSTLDSELEALVFEQPVFGDDDSLADLVNMRLPLTVRGPVADPKVGVDLSRMVKENLRKSVEDKLREKLGIGAPAPAPAPVEGEDAAPAAPEDPVNRLLDRLLKKKKVPK